MNLVRRIATMMLGHGRTRFIVGYTFLQVCKMTGHSVSSAQDDLPTPPGGLNDSIAAGRLYKPTPHGPHETRHSAKEEKKKEQKAQQPQTHGRIMKQVTGEELFYMYKCYSFLLVFSALAGATCTGSLQEEIKTLAPRFKEP